MMRRLLIPSVLLLMVAALAFSTASASPAGAGVQLSVPGNYCISCHRADDPRLATATQWKGSIAREVNDPCPAAKRIHEELYYTERMLLMIDRLQRSAGALPGKDQARLEGYAQAYSRQLDAPVTSLEAFAAEAQTTRYRLNKIYTALNDAAERNKRQTMLLYAGGITLIILGSLAWGLYNTRSIPGKGPGKPRTLLWRALFVAAVLALFALPVFRVPAAQIVTTTAAQQEIQSILDTADRAAAAADRAQARAWMLAHLGSRWNESEPDKAQQAFEEALTSLQQTSDNEQALWGRSLSVQEATIGVTIDMQKGGLIAAELNAARARPWSLPLIAVELNTNDPVRAAELLQEGERALGSQGGLYADLQLRGIALAWAEVEPSNAVPAAKGIKDASILAWTLRDLAAAMHDASLLDLAADAARRIEDPVQRARALREVAAVEKDKTLFAEALAALEGVTGSARAYALGDLAAASGDAELVEQIELAYADARTAALLRLGEYQAAWGAARAIADPYEQARAQAGIASAWGSAQAASQIGVPLYCDLALRDVAIKTGDVAAAESIHSAYYRVQAFAALGEQEKAIQAADGLADSYPLIELATVLAQNDPRAALALVEKMSREADKAAALRVIAASTNDTALFEQAKGMALAARTRGDSLASVQASLDLADALWTLDPESARAALLQAYETALRISIK